jgi:hypothetical protein
MGDTQDDGSPSASNRIIQYIGHEKCKVVGKCSIPHLFALVGSVSKASCDELQSSNLGPCRSQWPPLGLRPLVCWDREFESHRGHRCLSLLGVVCCQVEVSTTD